MGHEWSSGVMSAPASRSMTPGMAGDMPDAASHPQGLPPGVLPAASVYAAEINASDPRGDPNFQVSFATLI